MTATTSPTSTAIAVTEPVPSHQERLVPAGFLAGCTGPIRDVTGLADQPCHRGEVSFAQGHDSLWRKRAAGGYITAARARPFAKARMEPDRGACPYSATW
jgi:hypothetical protein